MTEKKPKQTLQRAPLGEKGQGKSACAFVSWSQEIPFWRRMAIRISALRIRVINQSGTATYAAFVPVNVGIGRLFCFLKVQGWPEKTSGYF